MKKYNINNYMYVQITNAGFEHLNKYFPEDYIKHCIENKKVEIDGETWYRLQCHEPFEILPSHFGEEVLFKTTVMFDEKDLE
jgi:hypothetical protein